MVKIAFALIAILCVGGTLIYSLVVGSYTNALVLAGVLLALSVELGRSLYGKRIATSPTKSNTLFLLNVLAMALVLVGLVM